MLSNTGEGEIIHKILNTNFFVYGQIDQFVERLNVHLEADKSIYAVKLTHYIICRMRKPHPSTRPQKSHLFPIGL